jgi:Zn-dependent protease with chaperone function
MRQCGWADSVVNSLDDAEIESVLGHELTGWLRRRGRAAVQIVGGLVLLGIGARILIGHLLEQGGL